MKGLLRLVLARQRRWFWAMPPLALVGGLVSKWIGAPDVVAPILLLLAVWPAVGCVALLWGEPSALLFAMPAPRRRLWLAAAANLLLVSVWTAGWTALAVGIAAPAWLLDPRWAGQAAAAAVAMAAGLVLFLQMGSGRPIGALAIGYGVLAYVYLVAGRVMHADIFEMGAFAQLAVAVPAAPAVAVGSYAAFMAGRFRRLPTARTWVTIALLVLFAVATPLGLQALAGAGVGTQAVSVVAVSADGRQVLLISELWPLLRGSPGETSSATHVYATRDLLAADLASGRVVPLGPGSLREGVVSPDGRFVAWEDDSLARAIHLADLQTGQRAGIPGKRPLPGTSGGREGTHVMLEEWSAEGGYLLLTQFRRGNAPVAISVVADAAGRAVAVLPGHADARWGPVGSVLYVRVEHCLQQWTPAGGLADLGLPEGASLDAVSPDGRWLLVATERGELLVQADTRRVVWSRPIPGRFLWSPDSRRFAGLAREDDRQVLTVYDRSGRVLQQRAYRLGDDMLSLALWSGDHIVAEQVDTSGDELLTRLLQLTPTPKPLTPWYAYPREPAAGGGYIYGSQDGLLTRFRPGGPVERFQVPRGGEGRVVEVGRGR